jgi:Ca-activated chloride channel family protein
MSFLAPAAFFLSLLMPLVILMYLLKLRRTEQTVSSVYLWRKMVRDIEANAPWQRLRRNWLLILQLLFLLTLILALARPFTWVSGYSGQSAILILDASASMASTDVLPNRLEVAKAQAQQIVESLPDNARLTVISAGIHAQVMVSSSLDRRQIHQAIDDIQIQMGGSDLTVALQLASAIAARQPDTQVIIFSDGRVNLPEKLTVQGTVRYSPIGIRGQNQAINLLTTEFAPGGQSVSAFAQVINYSPQTAGRRLAIFADGQLFNVYDLTIPPNETRPVLVEGLPSTTLVVEARLQPDDQTLDDVELDDRALAVLRRSQPAQVNLVTQGNRFLETVLNLLPNLQVKLINPDDSAIYSNADLTIFDSFIPISATLPAGNLFFIAPPRSTDDFTISGFLQQPVPIASDSEDALLANVNLEGISILDAAQINLPDWARSVIVTDVSGHAEKSPLLFTGETGGRRIAVLAFDLRHSDLPLQIAFPILFANLTQWLAPGASGKIPTQVTPGEAIPIFIPPLGAIDQENPTTDVTISVTHPDGASTRLAIESGQAVFADTSQLGLYEINLPADSAGGSSTSIPFAVNLFLPQESDNKPADSLPITIPQTADQNGSQPASEQRARHEWWRPWALLALALLTAEWLVYQRPALAYLINKNRLENITHRLGKIHQPGRNKMQ